MATAEPPNKHLFTEMSFSPDGKLQMDTSELRDILSDLLDEKLGYLKPLAENVTELKAEINKQKEVISKSQTKVHELLTRNLIHYSVNKGSSSMFMFWKMTN